VRERDCDGAPPKLKDVEPDHERAGDAKHGRDLDERKAGEEHDLTEEAAATEDAQNELVERNRDVRLDV